MEIFGRFAGKRVALLGLARSNMPLLEPLLAVGATVVLCDEDKSKRFDEMQVAAWRALGCEVHLGDGYLNGWDADAVFRTPGIRPDVGRLPELAARGTLLTSEMELFFDCCPCPILGVTGSDGKTTTTSLVAAILQQAGKRVWLGGNIGTPLLPQLDKMAPDDIAVVELSSFQLMTMTESCTGAVVTNLSPNHMDWHRDYDEYCRAKELIFVHQNADGLLVLNADNADCVALRGHAPGRVVTFGLRNDADVTVRDGQVVAFGQTVLPRDDWKLPGNAFLEDMLAAVALTWEWADTASIVQAVRAFRGVEHRLEWVARKNGVDYYNDSIASGPTRTMAGLRAFDQRIILIAGGKDKKVPFDELAAMLPAHVKHLILLGHSAAPLIVAAAEKVDGCPPMVQVDTMERAVALAAQLAVPGDVVALSPAGTSFDMFDDFAQRGRVFKKLVKELP